MSAVDVILGSPLCGRLLRSGWSKRSVVKICRTVVKIYEPANADENWTDSDRQPNTSDQQQQQLIFDIDDDYSNKDANYDAEVARLTSRQSLRTISPGLRDANKRSAYFVRPDWDAIEATDKDYERTLLNKRENGSILFFVEHGKSMRDGCSFIVTDPNWLLSQFFLYFKRTNGAAAAPCFWVQNAVCASEFWYELQSLEPRSVPPDELQWQAQCVLALLVHCGACMQVTSSNPWNVCFPIWLFKNSPTFSTAENGFPRKFTLLNTREFSDDEERDTCAYRLALYVCCLCDRPSSPSFHYFATFYRQHVRIFNFTKQCVAFVSLFASERKIEFYAEREQNVDRALVAAMNTLITGLYVTKTPSALFARVRTCCTSTCALCTFADVMRAVFLNRADAHMEADGYKEIFDSVAYAHKSLSY